MKPYLRNKERRARRAATRHAARIKACCRASLEANERRLEDDRRHVAALRYLDSFARIHDVDNRLVALLTHCVYTLQGRGNPIAMMHAMRKRLDGLGHTKWSTEIIDKYLPVTGRVTHELELRVTTRTESVLVRDGVVRGLVEFPNSAVPKLNLARIQGETVATRLSCDPIHYESVWMIDYEFHQTCREMQATLKTSRDEAFARATSVSTRVDTNG